MQISCHEFEYHTLLIILFSSREEIWHYDIKYLSEDECVFNKYTFPGIPAVVEFYMENRLGKVFLEKPVSVASYHDHSSNLILFPAQETPLMPHTAITQPVVRPQIKLAPKLLKPLEPRFSPLLKRAASPKVPGGEEDVDGRTMPRDDTGKQTTTATTSVEADGEEDVTSTSEFGEASDAMSPPTSAYTHGGGSPSAEADPRDRPPEGKSEPPPGDGKSGGGGVHETPHGQELPSPHQIPHQEMASGGGKESDDLQQARPPPEGESQASPEEEPTSLTSTGEDSDSTSGGRFGRHAAIIRQNSKADILLELQQLPSIENRRVLLAKKMQGSGSEEEEEEEEEEKEVRKKKEEPKGSSAPPPIPRRSTPPLAPPKEERESESKSGDNGGVLGYPPSSRSPLPSPRTARRANRKLSPTAQPAVPPQSLLEHPSSVEALSMEPPQSGDAPLKKPAVPPRQTTPLQKPAVPARQAKENHKSPSATPTHSPSPHHSSSSSSSAQPTAGHKPSEPLTLPSPQHTAITASAALPAGDQPTAQQSPTHSSLSSPQHSTSAPPAGDQPKLPPVSPTSLEGPPAPAEAGAKEHLMPSRKPQAKRRTLKRPSTTTAPVGTEGEEENVDFSSMPAPPLLSTHPGLKAVEPPVPPLRPSPPMATEEGGGEKQESVDSSSMPAPPPLSTHPGLKAVEPPVPPLRPSPPVATEEGGGENGQGVGGDSTVAKEAMQSDVTPLDLYPVTTPTASKPFPKQRNMGGVVAEGSGTVDLLPTTSSATPPESHPPPLVVTAPPDTLPLTQAPPTNGIITSHQTSSPSHTPSSDATHTETSLAAITPPPSQMTSPSPPGTPPQQPQPPYVLGGGSTTLPHPQHSIFFPAVAATSTPQSGEWGSGELAVSNPTHVQSVVKCGPMNTKRGNTIKKKRSFIRRK